jgi:hypothetical protein
MFKLFEALRALICDLFSESSPARQSLDSNRDHRSKPD